jgi:ubiquinone/menaquinone biosynthesis C-methylase UbiE
VTPAMLAVAREKFRHTPLVTFQMAHAEALPFTPESFDAVVSCNMLHHVREVSGFLGECARVLRPQGQLIVVDWSRDFPHARLAHYWLRLVKRSYTKMYGADELIACLTPLGLAVEQISRFFVPPFFGMLRVSAIKRSQTA